MSTNNMQGKTILLTGGNSGIGLEAAGKLAAMGAKVVITCRDAGKGETAKASIKQRYQCDVDVMLLDLSDFDSIRSFASAFLQQYDRLDVLINNAGLSLSERRETPQGFEYVLAVNHVGPYLLTELLLEKLEASAPSRIVCLSSAGHNGARNGMDWDDLQRKKKFNGQAYCQAKLGTIYWVKEMAKRYASKGISCYAVNPRMVATNFAMDGDTRGIQKWFFSLFRPFFLTPEQGAETIVWAASEAGIENLSGEYLQDCAPKTPSKAAQDDAAAERFWQLSEQWIQNQHP